MPSRSCTTGTTTRSDPLFLRFHRGRYPSTSQPERCRNDDYEYFGVVSPQYDQELALRHELHPVVRPRFLDDDERRGGQRAASPVGRGRGVSPPWASSRAPSRQAAAWSDRRPRTPTRTPLPPARSATPPPTRYFASSAPRFGTPRSSFRQGDVGDRGRADKSATGEAPTTTPVIVEVDETAPPVPPPTLRHQPTMMMFGINVPATPPPSRPSSSEVVPVHVESTADCFIRYLDSTGRHLRDQGLGHRL